MNLRSFENVNGTNHKSISAFLMFGYGMLASHMWDKDRQILVIHYLGWRYKAFDIHSTRDFHLHFEHCWLISTKFLFKLLSP